jgi:pimeloyl-ACP methyl ester carboxylesterase
MVKQSMPNAPRFVGSERAALLGISEGGPMCGLFAATYPERTEALVMIGSYANLKARLSTAPLSVTKHRLLASS